MVVGIRFPLELTIEGVPVSAGASSASKRRWQEKLIAAARDKLQAGYWLTAEPVAVTIFHFPDAPMRGDLDNIVKPILDAFSSTIYFDDRQVERLLVQKFEPGRAVVFDRPTPTLLECAAAAGERTYIRLDDDMSLGALP